MYVAFSSGPPPEEATVNSSAQVERPQAELNEESTAHDACHRTLHTQIYKKSVDCLDEGRECTRTCMCINCSYTLAAHMFVHTCSMWRSGGRVMQSVCVALVIITWHYSTEHGEGGG